MKPDRRSVLDELLAVVPPQGNPRKPVSLAGATHRFRDDTPLCKAGKRAGT
jgi:hypothetical protein